MQPSTQMLTEMTGDHKSHCVGEVPGASVIVMKLPFIILVLEMVGVFSAEALNLAKNWRFRGEKALAGLGL